MSAMKSPYAPLLLAAALVLGAVALPFALLGRDVALDASTEVLLAGDERAGASYDRLQAMLEGRTLVCVLLRDPELFSNPGARRLKDLCDGLEALPGVDDVKSLTHSRRPVRKPGFSLDPRKLIALETILPLEPIEEDAWGRLREFVLQYPLARDLFVSRDGLWALVLISVDRPLPDAAAVSALERDVERVLDGYRADLEQVHVVGFPFLEAEVREAVRDDVVRSVGLAALLVIGVLLLAFRSVVVLLAVLGFLAAGLATLPVLVHLHDTSVNLYTAMLVPLVAGLQLTFLTHVVSAYQHALREGPVGEALTTALALVFRPSWMAALTTIIGLASLLVCNVGLVREFGMLGAEAVGAVFALTFGPLMLVERIRRGGPARPAGSAPAASAPIVVPGGLADWVASHRRALVASGVLLVLACLPGLALLRTDIRATEFLSEQSAGRRGLAVLDEQLGGINAFQLELDCAVEGGAQTPEALAYVERLRRYVLEVPGVTNVYSYSLILGLMNQVLTGSEGAALQPPASATMIQLLTGVLRSRRYELLDSFLSTDGRYTSLLLRTRNMAGAEYLRLLEGVMAFAELERPPGITLDAKRGIHSLLAADQRIVDSQLQSLGLCLALVFLALVLLWRAILPALWTLLVNLPALAVVGGLLGYSQLPLNSVTVMVAAVVLGIAVDDCVHWLSFLRQEAGRFDDPRDAVRWTIAHKLKPMACTSAILVGGLSLFTFSAFPPVAHFGLVSAVALVVAFFGSSLLLPALVYLNRRNVMMGSTNVPEETSDP